MCEVMRFSFQHRAFYCYLIMSLWIFFLVAAMYKYMSAGESVIAAMKQPVVQQNFKNDVKLKRIITMFCNPPEDISVGTEGLSENDHWSLQGVIVVVRHGDRGPLTHVREGNSINCDPMKPSEVLKRYQEYIYNATTSGHAVWAQGPGPFHSFPALPASSSHHGTASCHLGQLTMLGVEQVLKIGTIFKQAYGAKLGWDETKSSKEDLQDVDVASQKQGISGFIYEKGSVAVYSTRYRRTFQSALALLWSFLPAQVFPAYAASIKESHSITFCFHECICLATERCDKKIQRETRDRLLSHPAIEELVKKMSKVVFTPQVHESPTVLRDALFAYVCHNAPLPCTEKAEPRREPATGLIKPHNNAERKGDFLIKSQRRQLMMYEYKVINKEPVNVPDAELDSVNFDLDYFNSQLDFNGDEARKVRDLVGRGYADKPKAPLDFDAQMEKEKLHYYQQRFLDNTDPNYDDVDLVKRNLDADFNFNPEDPANELEKIVESFGDDVRNSDDYAVEEKAESVCVRKDQVASLFTFLDWNEKQNLKSVNNIKKGILNAYGLIHNVVKNILKIVSKNRPKFVLYSGHDKTIEALILALGLNNISHFNVYYASRMAIEVHRRKSNAANADDVVAQDFYFRIVYNGIDVTRQLSFCRGKEVLPVSHAQFQVPKRRHLKAYLCPIENIVRFIHDDYFAIFNVSNYKDACSVR